MANIRAWTIRLEPVHEADGAVQAGAAIDRRVLDGFVLVERETLARLESLYAADGSHLHTSHVRTVQLEAVVRSIRARLDAMRGILPNAVHYEGLRELHRIMQDELDKVVGP